MPAQGRPLINIPEIKAVAIVLTFLILLPFARLYFRLHLTIGPTRCGLHTRPRKGQHYSRDPHTSLSAVMIRMIRLS
jgi:hypothetical protein